MKTKEYLLSQVRMFSDTGEVIAMLQYMADWQMDNGDTYPYEELEAICSLNGMHQLIKDFAEYVSNAAHQDQKD